MQEHQALLQAISELWARDLLIEVSGVGSSVGLQGWTWLTEGGASASVIWHQKLWGGKKRPTGRGDLPVPKRAVPIINPSLKEELVEELKQHIIMRLFFFWYRCDVSSSLPSSATVHWFSSLKSSASTSERQSLGVSALTPVYFNFILKRALNNLKMVEYMQKKSLFLSRYNPPKVCDQ